MSQSPTTSRNPKLFGSLSRRCLVKGKPETRRKLQDPSPLAFPFSVPLPTGVCPESGGPHQLGYENHQLLSWDVQDPTGRGCMGRSSPCPKFLWCICNPTWVLVLERQNRVYGPEAGNTLSCGTDGGRDCRGCWQDLVVSI